METEENKNQQVPEAVKKDSPAKAGIETYAGDMAGAMQNVSGGVIKKIIEEEEGAEKQKENLSPESSKNITLIILSAVFIVTALLVLFFLTTLSKKISTVEPVKQYTPIIFTDKNQFVEVSGLSKNQVVQTIYNAVSATDVKTGGIEGIYLTENNQVIGFHRFVELIGGTVPAPLLANVDDSFLLGAYNGNTKQFFILLKVKSFSDIFPPMKTWEGKMWSDLHGLFGMDINKDTNYLLTKDFEDSIVGNKNSRVLHDKDGNVVLEYIFASDTSVVIIANDSAINEITLRLANTSSKNI